MADEQAPTVPRATVEALADCYRELRELECRQKLLTAEMIRACVANLDIDVRNARMRGHKTALQRSRQIDKNVQDKAQARLYLLMLATSLEDASGLLDLSTDGSIIRAQ